MLVDGLSAEREQGITIDVAYRYFSSEKRKFIVADTPGHEQYTRNMVTGASTADLAVMLVDARKGVLTQTRRHSYLAKLVGIRRFVLAVNKMDLVDYDQGAFEAIAAEYRAFAEKIGIADWVAIPVSGLTGDNIVGRSERCAGMTGRGCSSSSTRFRSTARRMPRSRCGCRSSGSTGPTRISAASPARSRRARCARRRRPHPAVGPGRRGSSASSAPRRSRPGGRRAVGDADLADEVDCSRGDVIAAAADPPEAADQFEATIVWMAEHELLPGRGYWLKIGTQMVTATVQQPEI